MFFTPHRKSVEGAAASSYQAAAKKTKGFIEWNQTSLKMCKGFLHQVLNHDFLRDQMLVTLDLGLKFCLSPLNEATLKIRDF